MGWLNTILDFANVGIGVAQLGELKDLLNKGTDLALVQAEIQNLRIQIFNFNQAAETILDMEVNQPIIAAAAMRVLELRLQDSGITPELFSVTNFNDMQYVASTYKLIGDNTVRMRSQLSTSEMSEVDNMVEAVQSIRRLPEEISVLEDKIEDLIAELYDIHPKNYFLEVEDPDKIIKYLEEDIKNLRKRSSSNTLFGGLSSISSKTDDIEKMTAELKKLSAEIEDKRSQLEKQESVTNP